MGKRSQILILMGNQGDGKTTVGQYLAHKINKPTLIIDPAREFKPKAYRIFCYSVSEVIFYIKNANWKKSINLSKMQIVFRPKQADKKKQINAVCGALQDEKGWCIFFDEMELYANRYLTMSDNIYDLVYLARNRQHDFIIVSKKSSELSGLIKDMYSYFFIGNLEGKSSLTFFKDLGGAELEESIKRNTKDRHFLIIGRGGYRNTFKLDKKIAKLVS